MFSRRTVPVHPEDEKILSIIRELCARLNYYKFSIQSINWLDRIGLRRFPPDALMINPRFHTILLSTQAMGRLTPEEWRPILASGLLYYKNLNRAMLKRILPVMAVALLMPVVIFADAKLLGGPPIRVLFVLVLIALIIIIILSIIPTFLRQKRYFFDTDDKAAEIVGRESLIASLTKLGSLDPTMTSSKRGLFRPSVQQRIQHLTTFSP